MWGFPSQGYVFERPPIVRIIVYWVCIGVPLFMESLTLTAQRPPQEGWRQTYFSVSD